MSSGVVAGELIVVGVDELPPIAQAVELRRLVLTCRLPQLAPLAITVLTAAHRAVRAGEPRNEIADLVAAENALARLRRVAWHAYRRGELSAVDFDRVMIASARCKEGLLLARQSARRRGRRWIECPTGLTRPGWR